MCRYDPNNTSAVNHLNLPQHAGAWDIRHIRSCKIFSVQLIIILDYQKFTKTYTDTPVMSTQPCSFHATQQLKNLFLYCSSSSCRWSSSKSGLVLLYIQAVCINSFIISGLWLSPFQEPSSESRVPCRLFIHLCGLLYPCLICSPHGAFNALGRPFSSSFFD